MRLEFERLLPSLVDTQVLIDLNQDGPNEFAEVEDERKVETFGNVGFELYLY